MVMEISLARYDATDLVDNHVERLKLSIFQGQLATLYSFAHFIVHHRFKPLCNPRMISEITMSLTTFLQYLRNVHFSLPSSPYVSAA